MSKNFLEELKRYKENREFYTAEERKIIREKLKSQIREIPNKMIDIIDFLNKS
jgi:hypothetical protein